MAAYDFDSTGKNPMQNFDALPAEEYYAAIVESEIKPTTAGDGKRCVLKFEIMEGEHKGRFIWTGINTKNPNPKAVEIGEEEMAAICKAVGIVVLKNTEDLHNKVMIIKLKISKHYETGEPTNEITAYRAKD